MTCVLDKVVEDLRRRLGDGWIVEEMMHDSDRHPCELVETVGRVDVLLTAHGFQVSLLFLPVLLLRRWRHHHFRTW